MDDKLHCKKCGEPLIIMQNNEWKDIVLKQFELQELYCPKCGIANMEAIKHDK